ncbi:MAG: hypothetical protein QM689_07495 [Oscillospiraceae bacterium]
MNKTFWFDDKNRMAIGVKKIGDDRYYFRVDDGLLTNKWVKTDKAIYYFGKDGKAYTGWHTIKKIKVYFYSDGNLAQGFHKLGGKGYLFKDGVPQTGLHKINGKYYYFDKDGVMLKNTTAGGYQIDKNGVATKKK